ncbi:MAG TPA: carboxymuconolactone decarboxylase family protein [Acidimicrobiales bacterium]|nr:carboxymuconolactone decarboxylase family protein [Acidimicrobiales bacterium]
MSEHHSSPTSATARRPWEPRIDFEANAPGFAKAMATLERAATAQADQAGLASPIRDLVRLRASQLNGCAYCVDMHVKDARAAGERDERIDAVAVWPEVPFYDDAERAALALAEAVTLCADSHVPAAVWDEAAQHFGPAELAALIGLIVAINGWNRIGVATRTWLPGSYTV